MQTGQTLGAYRVLEKIGAGGMGEVYKAYDARLDRAVAIKILAPARATPDRLRRFEQEARSVSALNHPNILTIHDVGREGDIAYFAMEWVDGQTLRDTMAAGRVPVRRVLQLSHQIAEGLAKAHAAGIVHRDLKPENVMVTADGLVKVVDFGLAKVAEGAGAAAGDTMTRTVGSTPGMIDAVTQQTLWSDQYDRELADMLAVQSDVAMQIARALRASLSPDEQQRLEQRATTNPEAYAIYLQSQQLSSSDRAKNLAAIELLRRAVALDPRFAVAQARLAYRFVFMGYYDDASNIEKGMAEAEAALRINPSIPHAHFAIATGYAMKGRDEQARRSFLRAARARSDPGEAHCRSEVPGDRGPDAPRHRGAAHPRPRARAARFRAAVGAREVMKGLQAE